MGVNGKHEVVYFFDKQGVDKEMLYSEFESLLDSMVPAPELANRTVEAAYALLDGGLNLTALVFFVVSFDNHGKVDSRWNLPLRKLAAKGVAGPDLGGGACKIYMQGTNQQADYEAYLWDPSERNGSNDLVHLRNASRANRLCLPQEAESEWMGDASMVMREAGGQYDNAPSIAVAPASNGVSKEVFSEQQKALDASNKEKQELLNQLKQLQKNVALLEKELKKAEEALEKSEKQGKESLATLKQKIEKESKVVLGKQAAESEKQRIELEKQKTELEKNLDKKLKAFEKESQKQLDETRKTLVEEYKQKDQQIEVLKKELTELRGDKFRLMKGGADEFFQKLTAAEISFVSFKPGAGHMTIPLNDVASFIENPNVFAAKKCNISVEAYEIWLEHYNKPVCTAPLPDNKVCGDKINRTDKPVNYRAGESNRCKKHGGR